MTLMLNKRMIFKFCIVISLLTFSIFCSNTNVDAQVKRRFAQTPHVVIKPDKFYEEDSTLDTCVLDYTLLIISCDKGHRAIHFVYMWRWPNEINKKYIFDYTPLSFQMR